MESYEVLRDAFEKTSPKEISSEMSLSLSMVYKWAQPVTDQGSGSLNPLDRVAQLMKLTKYPGIIQWLCSQSGGFFVKNSKMRTEEEHEAVLPAMSEIVQQFADLLDAITRASADQKITKPEAVKIREEWEQLKTFAETFVFACEMGDFSSLEAPRRRSHSPRNA